jgi:RIO kinase 1
MEYIGDENMAAPMLNTIRLRPDEVEPLFNEVMRNVDIMLQNHWIHGDLSAYNILYWEGKITLIDFPQVIDSRSNPDAHFILQRDIVRICEYFAQQGPPRNALSLVDELWYRYGSGDLFVE